jgi:chromatin assembly factor 1 subunit B
MSSSDGFCSTLTFAPGELGQIYPGEVPTHKHPTLSSTAVSSSQNTPMATPTSTIPPPSPFPSSNNHHRTSSNQSIAPSPPAAPLGPTMRPSSPTRSNSTSSVATQASYHHHAPGTVISNPPLVGGTLPGVVAGTTGLGFITGVPMTTPPQTPRSTTSSVSGVKRAAGDASESEREDGGNEKKKRRIAPTLVPSEQDAPTPGA